MTDVAELLESLRWHEDMVVTNDFGERVWLKKCPGGITDCCPADDPCEFHSQLTHAAPGAKQ
jgi:hypothetical protein